MEYIVYVNVNVNVNFTWQTIFSCRRPKHTLKLATAPSLALTSGHGCTLCGYLMIGTYNIVDVSKISVEVCQSGEDLH